MVLVSKKLLHYFQGATTSDGDNNNKRCKCSVIETIKLTCLLTLQKINSITYMYITLPRVIAEVKMFKWEIATMHAKATLKQRSMPVCLFNVRRFHHSDLREALTFGRIF